MIATKNSNEAEVQHWLAEYIRGSDNPDMHRYGGDLMNAAARGQADRFLWTVRYFMDLGEMYDARVLDVGCGFGWHAVAFSVLGGNHVVANDIRPSMTEPLEERVAVLKGQGAPLSVEALTGDICELDLPDESFDTIFSNQTIEHVHNLEGMFDRCRRLLKPGGRCVVVNDNNALCDEQVAEIQDMWQKRDRSWEYIDKLKKERPIENADIEPYAVMRERIIRESNATLSDQDVALIVDATAGMIERDIRDVAGRYRPGNALPERPRWSWCRNPVTGEYCERQLNPYDVAGIMRSQGMRASVRHAFRKMPLRMMNGVAFRPLNRKLFNLRPLFVVVGERPA